MVTDAVSTIPMPRSRQMTPRERCQSFADLVATRESGCTIDAQHATAGRTEHASARRHRASLMQQAASLGSKAEGLATAGN